MDRRVSRTRRLARLALLKLLETKHYEDIQVAELLAQADLGRSTFYVHFSSKDDLLRQSMHAMRQEIAAELHYVPTDPLADRLFAFSLPLLVHVGERRAVYRHLRGRGAEIFRQEMSELVTYLVQTELTAKSRSLGALPDLTVQFAKGAFLSLMFWWLDRASSRSAEELDATFRQLIRFGIEGASVTPAR